MIRPSAPAERSIMPHSARAMSEAIWSAAAGPSEAPAGTSPGGDLETGHVVPPRLGRQQVNPKFRAPSASGGDCPAVMT